MGGGKYTATQNADGTWNLLDVPICGEIPEAHIDSHPWNGKPIDRAWMLKTVENHQRKFKEEGYLPPLHINHHGPGVDPEPAGKFLPTRVGKLKYDGKDTDVILADLTLIPDEVFKRIEKGELPYISIETGSWDDGKFTSCAIMDSYAPHFSFPNVTVGEKVSTTGIAVEELVGSVGMSRAYAGIKGGVVVLCKAFTGIKLADDDKGEADKDKSKPAFGKSDKSEDDDESAEEEKPTEVDQNPAVEGGDVMAILKQLLVTTNLIAKNLSGVGGVAAQDQTKDDENEAPVEQEKPMTEKKDEQVRPAAKADVEVKLGALEGTVAALKDTIETRNKKDALVALSAKYEAELKGWHLSDGTKKTIALMAEKGEDVLKAFVENFKATAPKDPPTSLAAFEQTVGMASTNDPAIEKVMQQYASRGPEVQEQVKGFVRLYAETKRAGLTTLSAERFVAAQFMGLASDSIRLNGAVAR